jgi:hypothetical protein
VDEREYKANNDLELLALILKYFNWVSVSDSAGKGLDYIQALFLFYFLFIPRITTPFLFP